MKRGWFGVTASEARSIASVLAKQIEVKIEEGDMWKYHFPSKTIFYRQEDLSRLTEIEVIGNLLHEAGHAKYSTSPADLVWTGVEPKHVNKLHEITNVIEDFRIEDLLRKEYPYAIEYLPEYSFKTAFELAVASRQYSDKDRPKYLRYCLAAYSILHGKEVHDPDSEITEAVDKTREALKIGRKTVSTQRLADIIAKDIYPHIKKFLDDYPEEDQELKIKIVSAEAAGQDANSSAAAARLGHDNKHRSAIFQYTDLFPTVRPLVARTKRSIARALTDKKFDRYSGNHRTGKLNERKLYKAATGNIRIFERKVSPKTNNYAFSLLIDVSGSMLFENTGINFKGVTPSQVHSSRDHERLLSKYTKSLKETKIYSATRAALLFSQILEDMDIPFSIGCYDDTFMSLKSFGGSFTTKDRFKAFQSMWLTAGGGTDLTRTFGWLENNLLTRKEKRVLFVMTDGEVDNEKFCKEELKNFEKRGVSIVGFGIGKYGNAAVKKLFTNYVLVPEVEDIPRELAIRLKRILKS